MTKWFARAFYTLAFGYTLYGVWLHSGPEEWLTTFLNREELYIGMGAGFALMGILSELMSISVES